jgi:transcriptional regulator with AAA-type ATPase domain
MTLLNDTDRRFCEALSRLAYSNPFTAERIEHERSALGPTFDAKDSDLWSRRPDTEGSRPNVLRLAERTAEVVKRARTALAEGKRASAAELVLYEDAALYLLYDQFRNDLHASLSPGVSVATRRLEFWPRFKREFAHFFQIDDVKLPSGYDAGHIFAGFFQIRRAFHHTFDFIVGQSRPAARLRAAVWESIFTHDLRRYRKSLYSRMSDISTLVCGPSGTGKELVARAVGLSRYIPFDAAKSAFVDEFQSGFYPINLSALSPTLIESDLFGHCKGSFTGATTDRAGWFEQCQPFGAVFLDEIGELETSLQVKLLRVVQTRTFSRLGESKSREFTGKLIAATNRDLAAEMQAGRFREDLYYRMCSDLIHTSPLREQLADAPGDLHHLVMHIAKRIVVDEAEEVAAEVEGWIESHLGRDYAWPGNIRELEQCVRNCLVRGEYRPPQWKGTRMDETRKWLLDAEAGSLTADELLTQYCRWAYAKLGTYEATADQLGLDRRTVRRRVCGES